MAAGFTPSISHQIRVERPTWLPPPSTSLLTFPPSPSWAECWVCSAPEHLRVQLSQDYDSCLVLGVTVLKSQTWNLKVKRSLHFSLETGNGNTWWRDALWDLRDAWFQAAAQLRLPELRVKVMLLLEPEFSPLWSWHGEDSEKGSRDTSSGPPWGKSFEWQWQCSFP